MRLLRLSWDFLFGILLIGGAPWCVLALVIILGDGFQKMFHVVIPDSVNYPLTWVALLGALAVFILAIRHRVRRRLLPKGFLALELLLGIGGALFVFAVYGVVMHSVID